MDPVVIEKQFGLRAIKIPVVVQERRYKLVLFSRQEFVSHAPLIARAFHFFDDTREPETHIIVHFGEYLVIVRVFCVKILDCPFS
jgi:hypothetical protein